MRNLNQKGNAQNVSVKTIYFYCCRLFEPIFQFNAQAFSFSDFLHIFSSSQSNSQENIKNTILARTEGLSPQV